MKWILIIYIGSGYGGGPTSAEFNSLSACLSANQTVTAKMREVHLAAYGWCFAAGDADGQ